MVSDSPKTAIDILLDSMDDLFVAGIGENH